MRKALALVLCLLIFSSCADKVAIGEFKDTLCQSARPETDNEGLKLLRSKSLDSFFFVIEADDRTVTVSGENINENDALFYFKLDGEEAVYERRTKRMYYKRNSESGFVERKIESFDEKLGAACDVLHHVGLDYKDFYGDTELEIISETSKAYTCRLEFEGDTYTVTVDKKTGVWTQLSCGDKILFKVKSFSLEKSKIPEYK